MSIASLFGNTVENEYMKKAKEKEKDMQDIYNQGQEMYNVAMGQSQFNLGKIDKYFINRATFEVKNPNVASMDELPSDIIQRAELVKTSSVLQKNGITKAIERMKVNSPKFELDADLSTTEYIVAKNIETGKIEIAFRGTDPGAKIKTGLGRNLPEPVMWPFIWATGKEDAIFEQHNMNKIIERIKTKYSVDDIEHISGYSMGGTKAHRLGEILNKNTTLLNPLLGKRFFDKTENTEILHRVIRTTDDCATLSGIIQNKDLPKNVRLDSIHPRAIVKQKAETVKEYLKQQIVSHHELEHFTTTGDRISDLEDANKAINRRTEQFMRDTFDETPENVKLLREQMLKDIEPHLKVMNGQVKKITATNEIMKGGKGVLGAVVGVSSSYGMGKFIEQLPEDSAFKNEYVAQGAIGAGAAAVTHKFLQKMTVSNALPALGSLKNAVLTGGASAVIQTATAEGINNALLNANVDYETAGIISESFGGGVGGASSVLIPSAIAKASQVLIARTATTATATAATEATVTPLLSAEIASEVGAEVATEVATEVAGEVTGEVVTEIAAEGVAEISAEVAAETALATSRLAFSWWNPFLTGLVVATTLGTVIAGSIRISQAMAPKQDIVLHPTRNEDIDVIVADNPAVKQLILDFNGKADYSQEAISKLELGIDAIVDNIEEVPEDYGYKARFMTVPRDYSKNTGVIYEEYDYSNIPDTIKNMNAVEYHKAIGDAKLFNEYPVEYKYLTNNEKLTLIEELKEKYPEITQSPNYIDNPDNNYRLSLLLDEDTSKHNFTKQERESMTSQKIESERELQYSLAIERNKIQIALEDYQKNLALTNKSHQAFLNFIREDTKANRFIANGDVNGLNRYLHSVIYDPKVMINIARQVGEGEDDHILENNIPQFNEKGETVYIKTTDKPIQISIEKQEQFIEQSKEEKRVHYNSYYIKASDKLMKSHVGNSLLQNDEIRQKMESGESFDKVNESIRDFIKTHPKYTEEYRYGKIGIPTFNENGLLQDVKATQKEIEQDDYNSHVERRKKLN